MIYSIEVECLGNALTTLTIQIHHGGAWRDAGAVEFADRGAGIASATTVCYDIGYFFEYGSEALHEGFPVVDARAVSVNNPVDMVDRRFGHWPPFLLDMLPQGHARRRLAEKLGKRPDDERIAFDLLLLGAGCPIGNLRVKEAWEAEQERLKGAVVRGVTTEDVLKRTPIFRDMAERFALVASGSSGVQGEWPKILLTQAMDGLWRPDPVVSDHDARRSVIVKMTRGKYAEDRLILASEAPYLELARRFGLRVGEPLVHRDDVLMIPRFDRAFGAGVVRFGQESLLSALGVADHSVLPRHHEDYIDVLMKFSADPAAEIVEYVLRDTLNRAAGDNDNHGRNTALQKREDGWIGLTPRFDFAPMFLDPSCIIPQTRWRCFGNNDSDYRADLIVEAIGETTGDQAIADAVADALADRADIIIDVADIARDLGTPDEVVRRAFGRASEVADALNELRSRRHAPRR